MSIYTVSQKIESLCSRLNQGSAAMLAQVFGGQACAASTMAAVHAARLAVPSVVLVGEATDAGRVEALAGGRNSGVEVVPLARLADLRGTVKRVVIDPSALLAAVMWYVEVGRELAELFAGMARAAASENAALRERVVDLEGQVEAYKAMAPRLEAELGRLQAKLDAAAKESAC